VIELEFVWGSVGSLDEVSMSLDELLDFDDLLEIGANLVQGGCLLRIQPRPQPRHPSPLDFLVFATFFGCYCLDSDFRMEVDYPYYEMRSTHSARKT